MKKFLKNQKGITMMEVLVTVGLLAIVIVPCLSSFVMAQRGNALASQVYYEYTEAQNLMETLKGKGEIIDQDELDTICAAPEYSHICATVIPGDVPASLGDPEQTQEPRYMTIIVVSVETGKEILRGVVATP